MIINTQLYGGNKCAYEKDEIECSNCENCSLYKKGECILADRMFLGDNRYCKYGKKYTTKGPGHRSSKFLQFGSDVRHSESYGKLKKSENLFSPIGDYYYFNLVYPRMFYNKVKNYFEIFDPYKSPWSYAYDENKIKKDWERLDEIVFIPKENLTKELLDTILQFKPNALMGGEIKDYQGKIIPQIIMEIKQNAPELLKYLPKEEINYVGMMARLNTLKPNIEVKLGYDGSKCLYKWDGEYLTTNELKSLYSSFLDQKREFDIQEVNIKIKPTNELYVKVEDNNWVLPTTIVNHR